MFYLCNSRLKHAYVCIHAGIKYASNKFRQATSSKLFFFLNIATIGFISSLALFLYLYQYEVCYNIFF